MAQLLLLRNIDDAAAVGRFLSPQFRDLLPPDRLADAPAAARRLLRAVRDHEPIVIYGDYDVDGVAATAILWHALQAAGASAEPYVPSRFEEGYGLSARALEQFAARGVKLVVSVDCGITAVAEARRARELGIDLIVTDHHEPRAALPDAGVIVHPTAGSFACPNPHLSGAGVALKVAWALARECSRADRVDEVWCEVLLDATAFAALGTIADVVPLIGENRIIAAAGLRHLRHTRNVGLKALIEVSGLSGKPALDDYDVGFLLGPRLNAVGRMGHAAEAVELFTTADDHRARQLAARLDALNRERQAVERTIATQAEALVVQRGMHRDSCRAIVLASPDWHPGVVGIVAARLVEKFQRPTILISLANGDGQGSGRSVRHFPLHEVLQACGAHLTGFGGHAMAAGVRLRADQVEPFAAAFLEHAARRLTDRDLAPILRLDDEVDLCQMVPPVVESIARMAPFGVGNPRPRFATGVVELHEPPRRVGSNGAHLAFTVRQPRTRDGRHDGNYRRAIAFNAGPKVDELAQQRRMKLAFEPTINNWNNRRTVELKVVDWQRAD